MLAAGQTPGAASGGESLRRRLLEALRSPSLPGKMTYQEFLAWANEDTLAEWVDGEVTMTSPATLRHQEIGAFLIQVVGLYTEQHALGKVLPPPFYMKLERSGRAPDLLFIAADHLARLQATFLDGPADLAVEIISPSSIGPDRGEKLYEYEAGGVPEYWLVDPQRRWAEFYQLEVERYRMVFAGEEGEYRSKLLPGFWLRVEWLWQDPLPRVLDVLRELKVV